MTNSASSRAGELSAQTAQRRYAPKTAIDAR